MEKAEKFFELIGTKDTFRIEKLSNGTNIFKLHVEGVDLQKFRQKLRQKNIHIPPQEEEEGGFFMKTNVTLNRISPVELAKACVDALH